MAVVANDYLMKRYPSRRKACRDPLDEDISLKHTNYDENCRRKSTSAYYSIKHVKRRVNE